MTQSRSVTRGDMAASLPNEPDDLLITDELHHRIAHKADYQREKLAIQDLARQMAEQPDQVLPRLVHLAMELCGGQSAGISLYEAQPPGPGIFRWHHLAGRYANFSGGTVPRDFSPSGVCFDADHPILMARPERVYDFLSEAGVPNYEVLLVPLYAGQPDPLGTLWVISHDEAIHFDSGDARVTTELAAFAGLALKMIQDASVLRASEERLNLALHQQEMLTREMSHRVKNLFAIAIGMVSISAKSAATPQDMAKTLLGRLNALARAHDLVLHGLQANGQTIREATLSRLLEAIFQPYTDLARTGDPKRIVISGPDLVIGERALASLALVLHELATNAAKYGALSIGEGLVRVTWQIEAGNLLLRWEERKGPGIEKAPASEGFGSILVRRSVVGQLGGELDYIWKPEGFSAFISIPMERLSS
jgi:two-component sensor histidine kinase